jgi:hypothetical protein
MSTSELKLGYDSGAGGFLLLHLLLLSEKYHIKFEPDISISDAIDRQWKILNHFKWKDTETWPNNELTRSTSTDLTKLYIFPKVWQDLNWTEYSGVKLMLYTDFDSQKRLCYYKRAGWYQNQVAPSFDLKIPAFRELLKNWQIHYQNIKDPSWPKCQSFRHIDQLSERIQKEVLDNEYTVKFLNYQYVDPIEKYQEHWVFNKLIPYLEVADIVLRLQDLVNSNGEILSEILDIPPINDKQIQLLKLWKSLHTPELLSKIGIH